MRKGLIYAGITTLILTGTGIVENIRSKELEPTKTTYINGNVFPSEFNGMRIEGYNNDQNPDIDEIKTTQFAILGNAIATSFKRAYTPLDAEFSKLSKLLER